MDIKIFEALKQYSFRGLLFRRTVKRRLLYLIKWGLTALSLSIVYVTLFIVCLVIASLLVVLIIKGLNRII